MVPTRRGCPTVRATLLDEMGGSEATRAVAEALTSLEPVENRQDQEVNPVGTRRILGSHGFAAGAAPVATTRRS